MIITNNVPRDIVEAYELTPTERENFDYIDWHKIAVGEDSATLVRYKGELIDLGEFQALVYVGGVNLSEFAGWDGYMSDSFFSGILVRYVDESCDQVIMGRYYT